MNLTILITIAAGGAIGSVLRYVGGQWVNELSKGGFPYGTLAVNVVGSLLIGIAAGWLLRETQEARPVLQAFLITGIMGGFTTFSAFSLETIILLQRGATSTAFAYISASILITLGACALGYMLVKAIT